MSQTIEILEKQIEELRFQLQQTKDREASLLRWIKEIRDWVEEQEACIQCDDFLYCEKHAFNGYKIDVMGAYESYLMLLQKFKKVSYKANQAIEFLTWLDEFISSETATVQAISTVELIRERVTLIKEQMEFNDDTSANKG